MTEFEQWLHDELEANDELDEFNAWLECHDADIIRRSVDVATSIVIDKKMQMHEANHEKSID